MSEISNEELMASLGLDDESPSKPLDSGHTIKTPKTTVKRVRKMKPTPVVESVEDDFDLEALLEATKPPVPVTNEDEDDFDVEALMEEPVVKKKKEPEPPMILDDADLAELASVEELNAVQTVTITNTILKEDGMGADAPNFTLTSPVMLTVKSSDGKYSKLAHIGGEEFTPVRCYAGKRGGLIFCFTPLNAAPYAEMEMAHEDANKHLKDFDKYIKGAGIEKAIRENFKAAAMKREMERNADRAEVYAGAEWGGF